MKAIISDIANLFYSTDGWISSFVFVCFWYIEFLDVYDFAGDVVALYI
jgi:hypothetical protein